MTVLMIQDLEIKETEIELRKKERETNAAIWARTEERDLHSLYINEKRNLFLETAIN